MRLLAATAISLILLSFAGIAAATTNGEGAKWWATHAGVTCGFGTGPQGRGVACIRNTQQGYAVTLTSTRVIVWLNGRKVFARSQR